MKVKKLSFPVCMNKSENFVKSQQNFVSVTFRNVGVPSRKACFPVEWRLLVKECLAKLAFNDFFVFGNLLWVLGL